MGIGHGDRYSSKDRQDREKGAESRRVLEVKGLSVRYKTRIGEIPAVDSVTFGLNRGDTLAVVGESGSGKSTLATALLRMVQEPGYISDGEIIVNGRSLMKLSTSELRSVRLAEIALVPQGAMNSLNPVARVKAQISDGIIDHRKIGRPSAWDLPSRIRTLLNSVGLDSSVAEMWPHELSGGMKQRAVMAIATALEPSVIVADEPTSALDVVVQRRVITTPKRLQQELDAAVILIGHDMGLVAKVATKIGVMYAGRLVEFGPIEDVFDSPRHPYTKMLIDSLPSLDRKRDLVGIPGLPPALLNLPVGCAFHPRCPYAFDRCREERPDLQRVDVDRYAACHLFPEHARLPQLADRGAENS